MPTVALLSARADFARALSLTVERVAPEYAVDVYAKPQSVRERIVGVLRREYDVIQVDETVRNGVVGALVASRRNVPLVTYVRGWADYTNAHGQHSPARHTSIVARSRWVFGRSAEVLFVSEVCRRVMAREYGIDGGYVVGRPFDTDRFASVPRETDDRTTQILTVTNLRYDEKAHGVEVTIDGLEPLFEANPDLRYAVAGGGRALSRLRERVTDSPYEDRIDVLGYCEDVSTLLSRADLFVYVSFLDSLSMAVLEAQAAGVPVIAGGVAGVPEAAGTAGYICPPTAEGVRHAIGELLTDRERRVELSRAGTERLATYNERAAREFVTAWEAVLS